MDDPRTTAGSFLLTGSATAPADANLHSGAGRIVSVRMRPLTLSERGIAQPTVSLAALLAGGLPEITGDTTVRLADYVDEILASGFPGLRGLTGRALRAQLDGYIDRVVEREFSQLGVNIRNPSCSAALADGVRCGVLDDHDLGEDPRRGGRRREREAP